MSGYGEQISFLVAAGIDRTLATEAIQHYNGNAQLALNRIFDGEFKSGMGGGGGTQQAAGAGTSDSRAVVPVNQPAGGIVPSGALNTPGGTSKSGLDQAIAQSLKEKQERDKSPLELQRLNKDLPVGLRNIGNTCFVNCLLQIYFHITSFRNSLLSLELPEAILPDEVFAADGDPQAPDEPPRPPPPADGAETEGEGELPPRPPPPEDLPEGVGSPEASLMDSRKNQLLTLKELQKCFAFLALSDKKYYDPTVLLGNFKLTGVVHQIGTQEDITEASDRFMKFLETTAIQKTVREMFYGRSVTEFRFMQSADDVDRSGLVQREDMFAAMHAVVGDDMTDFYDSLDQETSSESVAFTAGGDFKTTADKLTLIEGFPEVFTLQLRRIRFDAEAQVSRKVNTPFHYKQNVFFDRYLLSNKDEILRRREVNAQHQGHIDSLQAKLEGYLSNGKDGDAVIGDTLELLARLQEDESVLVPLRVVKEELQAAIGKLRDEETLYRNKILTAFDDMNGVEYVLHAVVVHEGRTVNMGHYCCYVKVNGTDWHKFNDVDVERVGEEVDFVKAIWEHPDKSVYLLFYLKKEMAEADIAAPGEVVLPFDLKTMVESENAAFVLQVEEFIEAEKKAIEEERNKFTEDFVTEWDKLPGMEKELLNVGYATTNPPGDPRIESYPFFCWLAGEEEVARYQLALTLYRSIVKHTAENSQEVLLDLVGVVVPPEVKLKELSEVRDLFWKVAAYFTKGIRFLTFTHYELASPMEAFRTALALDNLIPERFGKLRRRPEIAMYYGCVLYRVLTNGNDFLRRDGFRCVEYYQMILERAPYLVADPQFQNYLRFHIVESFFRTVSYAQQYYHRFNQSQCDTLNVVVSQFQAMNEVEAVVPLFETVEAVQPSFGIAEYAKYTNDGLAKYHRETKKKVNSKFYNRVKSYRDAGKPSITGRRPVKKNYDRFTKIYKPEKRRVRGMWG